MAKTEAPKGIKYAHVLLEQSASTDNKAKIPAMNNKAQNNMAPNLKD